MIGPFALVVLDMAGTTVRDDGVVDEAFAIALSSVGVDPGSPQFDAAADATCATPWASRRPTCSPPCSIPTTRRGPPRRSPRAYEEIVAAGRVAPMDGALELFATLRAARREDLPDDGIRPQHPRGRSSTPWAGPAQIDLALSPADCGRGRPAPDMIFGAMERLGVPDAGAVAVVGDTVSDLEAGTNAGARAVIGVLSGAHDRATLSTRTPHRSHRRHHRAHRSAHSKLSRFPAVNPSEHEA